VRRLVLLAVLLLSGCGGLAASTEQEALVLAERAGPQRVDLGWRESYGDGGRALRFEVASLAVLEDGWTARIAIENTTDIPFKLGSEPLALVFGLMLFGDASVETLDEANRAGALPARRQAVEIDPEPPARLEPGDRWEATISAPGALPAGSHVRVVFGTLVAVGEPPGELQPTVVWITDRSTRLR